MRTLLKLFILLIATKGFAQQPLPCPVSENKKALKLFEQAKAARKNNKGYPVVKEFLREAVTEDSTYAEALKYFGDAAYTSRDYKSMSDAYRLLINTCPDASAEAWYRLGAYLFEQKKYTDAIHNFNGYLEFGNQVKEENAKDANLKITRAKLMMNPVPFDPVPLKDVSGPDPEYLAIISPDQEYCFFTRRFDEQKRGALTPMSVEKFMMSKKTDGKFDRGEPLPLPFNKATSNNEGGASISIDNRQMFFTVNKNGNFDIYTSTEANGKWSEPVSLDAVNDPKQWDSQPSIGPENKTLYFASFRDSVNQTSDIYYSKRNANGGWSSPLVFGAPVSTPGNEKTPFMHPDNKTFYFSSDYLPGMGGYDIFVCKRNEKGEWGQPLNLGFPINTEADELGFFVSTDGKKGYFASNNLAGSGGYDIYEFDMPDHAKPDRVLFIKGDLTDENNDPQSARIELKNMATKEVFEVNYDSVTGRYASVVLFDQDYILTVKKQGYAYNSAYFSVKDSGISALMEVDLKLRKTEIGKAYTLNNILFATNSAELNEQDKNIIEDFSSYLKLNPSIKVAIHGHTDDEGDAEANLILSKSRAQAVYDYLTGTGINPTRLSHKGFGETMPLADNQIPEGRAQNRRTEFVIISK